MAYTLIVQSYWRGAETESEMWSSAITVWYYTAKYEIDVGGNGGTDGIVVHSFFHLWVCIFVYFCSFDNI